MKNEREIRGGRNAFIEGSFRDTADRDYIAARILYRHQLTEQFLWNALQAIEKYLKAILLFNGQSVKHLNHNIEKALAEATRIEAFSFHVTQKVESFVSYLNVQGPDRYYLQPRFTEGHELQLLDSSVWQIRRFCDDFFFPYKGRKLQELNAARLRYVQTSEIHKKKAAFRLDSRGFLETVLDGGKHPVLRSALVHNNLFFSGSRKRSSVTYQKWKMWSQSPNFTYPEILEWARNNVMLPKSVKAEMRRRNEMRTRRSSTNGKP